MPWRVLSAVGRQHPARRHQRGPARQSGLVRCPAIRLSPTTWRTGVPGRATAWRPAFPEFARCCPRSQSSNCAPNTACGLPLNVAAIPVIAAALHGSARASATSPSRQAKRGWSGSSARKSRSISSSVTSSSTRPSMQSGLRRGLPGRAKSSSTARFQRRAQRATPPPNARGSCRAPASLTKPRHRSRCARRARSARPECNWRFLPGTRSCSASFPLHPAPPTGVVTTPMAPLEPPRRGHRVDH